MVLSFSHRMMVGIAVYRWNWAPSRSVISRYQYLVPGILAIGTAGCLSTDTDAGFSDSTADRNSWPQTAIAAVERRKTAGDEVLQFGRAASRDVNQFLQ
jgi:hypothetical protein